MPDPGKDFTSIQEEHAFFLDHCDEHESDIAAYAEYLRGFVAPQETLRLLDFGCGPGTFTSRFLDCGAWDRGRVNLSLVEPSDKYRQKALAQLGDGFAGPVRAWAALPEGLGGVFDVILANHVFYYVPDLEAALRRLAGTLAPGGRFLISISARSNPLIDFWFKGFPLIGQPVPYNAAEDVEAALSGLGLDVEHREALFDLTFVDNDENRLKILRFLFGQHMASLPTAEALSLFDPYAKEGRIEIHTSSEHYHARKVS
jgi:trans-aconitate 2-methyltransferase